MCKEGVIGGQKWKGDRGAGGGEKKVRGNRTGSEKGGSGW